MYHRLSKIFWPRSVIPKNAVYKSKNILSKSQRLMLDLGLIKSIGNGIYQITPIAQKALDKCVSLVTSHMNKIEAQKVTLSILTPRNLWEKTGRVNIINELFFINEDNNKSSTILGPTHEESVTFLLAQSYPISYKQLPIKLYQIGPKFRNELKPRFGLIRAKEFLMKDLYSFDKNLNDAEETYKIVTKQYENFFNSLQIPWTKIEANSGMMGGQLSHEYHIISDIGEDIIVICSECGYTANEELYLKSENCLKCKAEKLSKIKGIEIGHTFLLNDKYSKPLQANFLNASGKTEHLVMGCYGIGISRLIAACLETYSNTEELKWPSLLVPYDVCIILPKEGSKEALNSNNKLSFILNEIENVCDHDSILIDDRSNLTIGKRLLDAKVMGYPNIIILGSEFHNNPSKLEIIQNTKQQTILVWGYQCKENKCIKVELNENNYDKAVSQSVCKIFCGENIGTLWPKPTGAVKLGSYMAHINIKKIIFDYPKIESHLDMWYENKDRLLKQIYVQVPDRTLLKDEGRELNIKILVDDESKKITMNTNESYILKLNVGNNKVLAEIFAPTYFGARHGLETLSQLIVFDDIRRQVQIVAEVEIHDEPVYKHRGLLLDTSRNYFTVDSIKKTIDGMAMTKLNTFHWHITDSHSFPLVIKSQPELYKLGAYSARQIYTPENVKDIIEYARIRGVRVIPEFDAPAHVGEGWQKTNMTVCFRIQPWNQFCVEPPCGQLNPIFPNLYDVLQDIYTEMLDMFQHPDVFHMGGDEVSAACWNTSEDIQKWMQNRDWELNNDGFMKLWGHFQNNALERLDRISELKLPIIMWTSGLTEKNYVEKYLDKNRYIIQVWTTGNDERIQTLLKLGYHLILSNYDSLYFDCGGAAWVTEGNNWCSPYIGWQKVYENRPKKIAGEYLNQILGSEAAIWSEQIDDNTLDARFWPRASALAERLWSDPDENWTKAESRLLLHRKRLSANGLKAEAMQPEWCLQNEGECPILSN